MYVVGYFMALAFYYGAIKPNLDNVTPKHVSPTLQPKSGYNKPLPMPGIK